MCIGVNTFTLHFTPVLPQLFPQTTQNKPKNIGMLWKQALQLPLKKGFKAL